MVWRRPRLRNLSVPWPGRRAAAPEPGVSCRLTPHSRPLGSLSGLLEVQMHSILTRFNILAGIALLALLAACSGALSGGDNQPEDQPSISISAAAETVAPEATLRLTATLSGSGANESDIHWSATAGQLSPETGAEVDWTAPATAGSYGITAQLGTDGTGANDSITVTVAEAGAGAPGGNQGDDGRS